MLWLCNSPTAHIQEELGDTVSPMCGWQNDIADILDESSDIELTVVSLQNKQLENIQIAWGNNSTYIGIFLPDITTTEYDDSLEYRFKVVIDMIQPDIVHIFGTEYMHTLAMVRAYNRPIRTVIHIQGLVSEIAKDYYAFLPNNVIYGTFLSGFYQRHEIYREKAAFEKRGVFEVEAIKNVGYIMGRTEWDRECTHKINSKARYHHVEELLRQDFFDGQWNSDNCKQRTLFMTQGAYPIKGLHLVLEALRIIKVYYPDIELRVAGTKLTLIRKLGYRNLSYNRYIDRLITKYELQDNVTFLGLCDVSTVKQEMLNTNIYILPSSIENSSNSLGEAALLGVPIVASNVGGTPSVIEDEVDGLLYPAKEIDMLAKHIMSIIQNKELAERLSQHAREMAHIRYNREKAINQLLETYDDIVNEKEDMFCI